MHLTDKEVLKAAKIAAGRFGSSDPAIDQEDFVSIAALRIAERDPTTIGTAVFVGREAIGRIISQTRYRKEGTTARGNNVVSGWTQRLDRTAITTAERKRRRFVWDLLREIGGPLYCFGRFGVAYPAAIADKLAGVWFDQPGRGGHRERLLVTGSLTDEIKELAEKHYVCLLVIDAEETNQTETTEEADATDMA